jgi:hypothetical protein
MFDRFGVLSLLAVEDGDRQMRKDVLLVRLEALFELDDRLVDLPSRLSCSWAL